MIIVFDLDDTLYKRDDFVSNGLENVSRLISSQNNLYNKNKIFKQLKKIYYDKSIKNTFNFFLKKNKITNIKSKDCINVYRYEKNRIKIYSEAKKILKLYNKKCYLVTDGHKLVQQHKIQSLKINKYFKKIFITNRYGLKFQKPSLYCFRLIKKIEKCSFKKIVYIGDNPNKDFINCNKIGIRTIRLMKGEFKNIKKKYPYDAKIKIQKLSEVIKYCKVI